MRMSILLTGLGLVAGHAVAEVRGEEFVIGDQLVRIEVVDPVEVMSIGPSPDDRTQVLSGPDIEIVGVLTDDAALQMLGMPVLVVVVPGTHSCENLGDPLAYHVVTLGKDLVTDGPLTTCVELSVSATPGAVVLAEDPMGDGESWTWTPVQGWSRTAG